MSRNSHNAKNKDQKDFYRRYIKEKNYEPTIDESLPFNNSSDRDEDFSVQQANRKRKEPAKDIILRHFEENWIKWLFSIAGLIMFYFFVTFQINLTKTDSRSTENEKDITNLESKIEKKTEQIDNKIENIEAKNQQQDLDIQRNTIILEEKKKK